MTTIPSWRRNSNTFPGSPSSNESVSSFHHYTDDELSVPLLRSSQQNSPVNLRRSGNIRNSTERRSLLKSSLTINRPPPDPIKPANIQRSLQDFIIILLVLLLSESARGIVLPTFSPFVTMIGGNAVWLGFAVGAFSAGRFVSTIGLGYLSDKLSYKVVLSWSVLICVIGNICYSLSDVIGLWCMIVARIITGFGAGTLSVIRAYTAHITLPSERTRFMSILGAVQFFGFAITPGLGSALAYIPEFAINGLRFNKYTMPGYLLAIVNVIILLVLLLFFQNPAPVSSTPSSPPSTTRVSTPPPPPPPSRQQLSSSVNSPTPSASSINSSHGNNTSVHSSNLRRSTTIVNILRNSGNSIQTAAAVEHTTGISKKRKYMIFAIFLSLNLLVRLVLGVIETLGTPMYVDIWDTPEGRDVEAGFVFGGLGLIGMAVLFGISYLSKKLSDLTVMVAGLACLAVGSGFLVGEDVGLARFVIGCALIWCIGYPLSQTIIVSMFSKSLGSAPQGGWMGWIGAMGSAGRVIGPIISGSLYHKYGQTLTMVFCVVVSIISLLVSFLLIERKPKQKPSVSIGSARD